MTRRVNLSTAAGNLRRGRPVQGCAALYARVTSPVGLSRAPRVIYLTGRATAGSGIRNAGAADPVWSAPSRPSRRHARSAPDVRRVRAPTTRPTDRTSFATRPVAPRDSSWRGSETSRPPARTVFFVCAANFPRAPHGAVRRRIVRGSRGARRRRRRSSHRRPVHLLVGQYAPRASNFRVTR